MNEIMNEMMNKMKIHTSDLLCERYFELEHPSGLTVYVFPKKMSATYALIGVKYGSINNLLPSGNDVRKVPEGIAHFLEHKLFFNEDGSDSFEKFSEFGADANAYTSFDKTVYLFSCTENFTDSLRELVSFVTKPYFTEESVAREVGIISEEIKMYEDSPSDKCFYGMLEGMYLTHSIKNNICGSESSIRKITPKHLYDCHSCFYSPDNMVLVVCGDVDPSDVMKTIAPLLPEMSAPSIRQKLDSAEAEPRSVLSPLVQRRMQVSKPIFNIGFKDATVLSSGEERLRRELIMSILNEMLFSKAGPLYSSLLDRQLISPALYCSFTTGESFAFNSIAGEADDPELILEEILSFIDITRKNGLSESDLIRTKKVLYAEWIKSFDSVEEIANTLLSFVCDKVELFDYVRILQGITLEDVTSALTHSFDRETATLSVVRPINN